MKYKVTCANPNYNGITANVLFKNGIAYVGDTNTGAINYFTENNYNIIDYSFLNDLSYGELKSYANQLGIKFIGVTTEQLKDEILKKEGML